MPWYRYDGNILSNDKTAVLRLLDKANIPRDVSIGGTIELTANQLDVIDDRHTFAAVSGPGATAAPVVTPRYLMVNPDGSLVDTSGAAFFLGTGADISKLTATATYASGAYPARPSGYASVRWVGPTQPPNWIDGDEWVPTS